MALFDRFLKDKKVVEVEIESEFDEYCENCGELLEDCECDDRWISKQDASQEMDDLEFDEMNDVWDEMDEEDEIDDDDII